MTSPTTAKAPDSKRDGLKVIHAGLMRTGTTSMAEAYRTLGYRAHHSLDDILLNPWIGVEKAAEATYPALANLPGYTYVAPDGSTSVPRPPFQREDWDRLWAGYDISTDLASPFTLELIKAYPEAKVVVVERKFETWWPSIKGVLIDPLYGRFSGLRNFVAWDILGIRGTYAMRKIHAGFFGAPEFSKEWITEARARKAHKEFYREVREAVPIESGRRLDYALGSGWGPICDFLGKEVPNCEFPSVNDREAMARSVQAINVKLGTLVLRKITIWVVPVAVLLFFVYR